MRTHLKKRKFIVIDLNSGRYVSNKIGHEVYNLSANSVDGRFYGYCPPNDEVNIQKLGAKKADEHINGILVIYVRKISGSNDREIIAFCDNATVHRTKIDDWKLQRWVENDGKKQHCSYTVESDYIYDLTSYSDKFRIKISDYNPYMFRMQRFYSGQYEHLDHEITTYLEKYLDKIDHDDDFVFQEEIQNVTVSSAEHISGAAKIAPQYAHGSNGTAVRKNSRISKQALAAADYKCEFDASHITFTTPQSVPYMEGHHLIPCTCLNAERFWGNFQCNIDCEENIVCLCPTCHRRIHFGSEEEQRGIIEQLYQRCNSNLKSVGIKISLQELLELYKK